MQSQCNSLEAELMNIKLDVQRKEKKPKRKVHREEKEVVNGSLTSEGSRGSKRKVDVFKTPYRHEGEIVYIVNVDERGNIISAFKPEDFMNLRGRKGGYYEWMVSSPGRNQNLYSVMVNREGKILCGVRAPNMRCV